ncbi:MAG: CPBP family intramembrane metalloprotease [Tidjanibacter sp.]|nr:CPBP family intramembrane metalloprotease [Tidjanibacter sp.]
MKKAIIYSAVLCGVSWIAALVFHLATGYTGPESGVEVALKFRTFAMAYMFLPAIVALVMQAVGGELSIVRRHATRIQIVPTDNSLLKFRPRWSWLVAILTTVAMVALSLLFSALFADFSTMKETTLDLIIAQGIDNVPAEQIAQVEAMPEWVMVLSTVLSGIFAGVTINALFAFGEEYGWRCYMVKALGGRKFLSAALLIGFVWGIWHAPMILMGHNYPDARVAGVGMMVLFCILGGIIELYFVLKSGSMWAAVFIHGTINALAGMAMLMYPGSSALLTGMTGVAGMMAMVVVIALLYLYDRSHDRIFHSTL